MTFYTIIGIGIILWHLLKVILLCLLDHDLHLAFYEKFGKPIAHLRGKVVFITGASSGIGKHTALALAKHGVKLVLAARRQTELERVQKACIGQSEGKLGEDDVLVLKMDMLDFDSHEEKFHSAVQHFGRVDVLFNNAGRSQRAHWEDIDLSVDREMFDLNVFSVVNLSRIAVKYFNTVGCGHVAVTSSLAGITGVLLSATYAGAKHAVHGYLDSLRMEKLGSKFAVTIICPGPVFTDFLQESFTAKVGEKYGVAVSSTNRRMTAERCGELCAVALANQASESWIGPFPYMLFTYFRVYYPMIADLAIKMVNRKTLVNLREGR